MAAWAAPLLLAAPFASQDVWVYVAQGKLVASGFGGFEPRRVSSVTTPSGCRPSIRST